MTIVVAGLQTGHVGGSDGGAALRMTIVVAGLQTGHVARDGYEAIARLVCATWRILPQEPW